MNAIRKAIIATIFCVLCFQSAVVVDAASKPKTNVPMNKISFEKAQVSVGEGKIDFSIKAKNKSKNTAKKIEVKYAVVVEYTDVEIQNTTVASNEAETTTYVEEQTTAYAEEQTTTYVEEQSTIKTETIYITAQYKKLKKGKKATLEKSVANANTSKGMVIKSVSLVEKKVYSQSGVLVYNANTGKEKLKWGTKDKKAPKITGLIEKDSYEGSDCYITIFADKKKFNYSKYIKAVDDRDGKVKIKVNTDKINWNKRGDYKVTVTATDKAGNKAKSWLKVHVEPKGMLCEMADDILGKVVSKSWSEEKKIRAIYRYVQVHISYVDSNSRYSWQDAAMNGVRYGNGNCFTYYAMSKLLISRLGIPNLEISRYPAAPGNHHWWNLVYTNGGWYHFDTTPRIRKSYLCLLTDAQLRATGHYSSFVQSKYPSRAKKPI